MLESSKYSKFVLYIVDDKLGETDIKNIMFISFWFTT